MILLKRRLISSALVANQSYLGRVARRCHVALPFFSFLFFVHLDVWAAHSSGLTIPFSVEELRLVPFFYYFFNCCCHDTYLCFDPVGNFFLLVFPISLLIFEGFEGFKR